MILLQAILSNKQKWRDVAGSGTHRAEVRVEAAADVADGLHQLRHYFFQPLRIHAPPFLSLRYISENKVFPLITSLRGVAGITQALTPSFDSWLIAVARNFLSLARYFDLRKHIAKLVKL